MSDTSGGVAERLTQFVAAQLGHPDELELRGVRRTSAGLSRENWVFDASWRQGDARVDEALILRRDPPGSVLLTERTVEVAVLRALEHTPVPAPRVRWADEAGAHLGRPSVVMHREVGECEYFCLTNDARPLEVRVALAQEFVGTLAAVATLDWRSLGLGDVLADPRRQGALFRAAHRGAVARGAEGAQP